MLARPPWPICPSCGALEIKSNAVAIQTEGVLGIHGLPSRLFDIALGCASSASPPSTPEPIHQPSTCIHPITHINCPQ